MKKKQILFLSVLILLFINSIGDTYANQKNDIYINIHSNLSGDFLTGESFTIGKTIDTSAKYKQFPGIGVKIGIGIDYILSKKYSISTNGSYIMQSSRFDQLINKEIEFQSGIANIITESNIILLFQSISISSQVNYKFYKDFSAFFGLEYYKIFSGQYTLRMLTYKEGEKENFQGPFNSNQYSSPKDLKNINSSMLNANFGISYNHNVNRRMRLRSSIGIETNLNSLSNKKNIRLVNIFAQLSGSYLLPRKNQFAPLYTSVKLKTMTNGEVDANAFHYERIITNNHFPLLNLFFFEEGKSILPLRYVQMSSNECSRFNPNQNKPKNPLDLYYNILNILGYRMQKNPLHNIELYSNSLSLLDERRKQAIRNYLRNRWNISSRRVKVKGVDTDVEENAIKMKAVKGCEMLFMPVVKTDTTDKELTNKFVFNFDISDTTGMEKWRFQLYDNTRQLLSFTQNTKFSEITYNFNHLNPDKIRYTLLIKGREGFKNYTVRSKVIFQKKYTYKYHYNYYLVWDKPKQIELNLINTLISKKIQAHNFNNKVIYINSFADDPTHRRTTEKISKYRGILVKKAAGLENSIINNYGNKGKLFPGEYPEIRYYNNLVEVVIK